MAPARLLAALARDLEAFAFPQRCPGCGALASPERLLCARCLERIPRVAFAVCAACLARGQEPVGCLRHPARQVWPAWLYDERAAVLVHALKYRERPGLAAALGTAMAESLPVGLAPDLVTAVPLHPARRRERGYNQAALLAEALAAAVGAPFLPGALARTRPTRPQARLEPEARRRNLAGAFAVRDARALAGRRVLVVDDVITTGATLEACLASLAGAGAHPAGAALAWAQ